MYAINDTVYKIGQKCSDLSQNSLTSLTSRNTTLPESKCAQPTKEQIRVPAFIDAPVKGQAFGQRAKQAMSVLVFGKTLSSGCTPSIVIGGWL